MENPLAHAKGFLIGKNMSIISLITLTNLVTQLVFPQYVWAISPLENEADFIVIENSPLTTLQGQTLIQSTNPDPLIVKGSYWVITTGYSSTPDQTDATPFITASGTYVRDGIIACNFLKFGTRVQFPQLYGDKIFVVEDRMALKNSHKIDIWFPDRAQAIEFGLKRTQVAILES